ncbi:DUF2071 domain-containing protein [Acrocarpospora sp. B8E8]|uniref:YqjF family protein n=1 Tax=Acrocarpospora sp. B8E8 TaxID=3153572 RepID=UPI00325EC4FB
MRAPPSPTVSRPVMHQRWSELTFVHWRYPAGVVAPLLPPGLTVETFDGSAWVGLVPFLMKGVRLSGTPPLPWLSRFPETNVRTYVHDESGRSGVWFFSLDAARLPAVLGGRAGFRLPYFWSDMSVTRNATHWTYRSHRRHTGVRANLDVNVGPHLDNPDELAHFLTARYRLFNLVSGRLAAATVEHPPWPLNKATLTHLDETILQAANLPAPDNPPLLHASLGVPVRVGMWH